MYMNNCIYTHLYTHYIYSLNEEIIFSVILSDMNNIYCYRYVQNKTG